MKKRILAIAVTSLASLLTIAACAGNNGDDSKLPFNYEPDFSYVTEDAVGGKTLKVGAILIGDETEGYTEAHIAGIEKAKEVLEAKGAKVEVSYEKRIPDADTDLVKSKITKLTSDGNNLVVTNSYGHQNAFEDGQFDVTKNPDVDYIAMTGDTANLKKLANFHNAFNATYQSRYMAGYVAGLKLQEMEAAKQFTADNKDKDGNIKIGYVGAFPYAEVKSGYTAFFLGIQEVFPKITMDVKFVDSWWDHDKENAAAKDLIARGCCVISQHADSTGAPEACEEAMKAGKRVYNVGYNVSMREAAPHSSLTSATNNWAVYYTHAFFNKITGKAIETDWAEGYETGAVAITALNYDLFDAKKAEIEDKVVAETKKLHDGERQVFDNRKWTVKGEHITTYQATMEFVNFSTKEAMTTKNGVTYFDESNASKVRCAPYFDIDIDGINPEA